MTLHAPELEKCVEILERWDRRFDSPERILADLIPIIENSLLREMMNASSEMLAAGIMAYLDHEGPEGDGQNKAVFSAMVRAFARERGLLEGE